MDTLNQVYSDILTTLDQPNVIVKEFQHHASDSYHSMRNTDDDVDITLRTRKTLLAIINKHYKPNNKLIIHFIRSSFDIEGDGSKTLDCFYYVKYEPIKFKTNGTFNETLQEINYCNLLKFQHVDRDKNKNCVDVDGAIDGKYASYDIILNIFKAYGRVHQNILVDVISITPNFLKGSYCVWFYYEYTDIVTEQNIQFQFKQYNLCPEVVRTFNTTGTLNECFESINPVYIGLTFSEFTNPGNTKPFKFDGEFTKTESCIHNIISSITKTLSKTGYDLTVDVFEIQVLYSHKPDKQDTYTVWTRYKLTKHNRLHKGRVIWTEPVVYCPYVPKVFQEKPDYANNNPKLVYTDYPTANFYQIETLCTVDEFDWWKAIGEEILSMDDVDEAVKFHKQFYPSTQKFRLVKVQKQLLGEV